MEEETELQLGTSPGASRAPAEVHRWRSHARQRPHTLGLWPSAQRFPKLSEHLPGPHGRQLHQPQATFPSCPLGRLTPSL